MAYLYDLQTRNLPKHIGGKAQHLHFLSARRFPVPPGWVCTWDAAERRRLAPTDLRADLRAELRRRIDPGHTYAVRSSANSEDSQDHSFAGQFRTVLDVRGDADALLEAMETVWASAQTPDLAAYLAGRSAARDDLKMAVIIQKMATPVISGVAFSKNPLTGLDEVIVEAVTGSGAALMQDGVTPQRWVHKWGDWSVQGPADGIPLDLIGQVVAGTKAIARAFGAAVDLEWVYDGQTLWWVQLREITTIRDVPIYSNRIAREMLPGIIRPLVWSVNVPLVNGAWVRVFTELIGSNDIAPESLARSFYYRAYFNMGTIGRIFEMIGMPRESLELMMGIEATGPAKPSFRPSSKTYRLMPRLLRFVAAKLGFARQVEAALSPTLVRFRAFHAADLVARDEHALLAEIEKLYALAQATAYFNILTPLLMQIYNGLLRSALRRAALNAEALDVTRGLTSLRELDPNPHLARLHEHYAALPPEAQAQIAAGASEAPSAIADEAFRGEFVRFLAQFGHLSDSGNDFAAAPWRETPGLVLKMIAGFGRADAGRGSKLGFDALPLTPFQRWWLGPLYRRARQFRLLREQVSDLYTYGYGLFRIYFLALGERLAGRGVLNAAADIFYLSLGEVREAVTDNAASADAAGRIAKRKQEIEAVRDALPPTIIYGDQPLPLENAPGQALRGTPTARGYYRGPVKVISGLHEFDKLTQGDVLVMPYSDVGWTPLFSKAGAVVAESGGMLSHSSIVAREYGLPAVVSVPGACRLADGTLVTVDGYRGEVIVHATGEQ